MVEHVFRDGQPGSVHGVDHLVQPSLAKFTFCPDVFFVCLDPVNLEANQPNEPHGKICHGHEQSDDTCACGPFGWELHLFLLPMFQAY